MSNLRKLALATLLVAGSAASQTYPEDQRVQTVPYSPGHVVAIRGTPGYEITVELSPDEQVQNIAIGDSSMWQAVANRRGDFLFLKPLAGDGSTNMTVITNVRIYNFELIAGSGAASSAPWHLRFAYPTDIKNLPVTADRMLGPHPVHTYRISGDPLLRPTAVREDGERTYISWPSDRALPAVFALTDSGEEALVDGMMRNDVVVIDRVISRLIFRMDRRVARADQVASRRRH